MEKRETQEERERERERCARKSGEEFKWMIEPCEGSWTESSLNESTREREREREKERRTEREGSSKKP